MGIADFVDAHVFSNLYSVGTFLVAIFTSTLAIYFLRLPNKSKSTFHLGMSLLYLSIFNLGYFFAAIVYHPNAAYHRWLTGVFILPGILHFGQFFFKYPKDMYPGLSKVILVAMYVFAIFAAIVFCYETYNADRKYHFTGHYWDFDAEPASRLLAILIAIYSFLSFLVIGLTKAYMVKTKERWTIIKMMIAMIVGATGPNITNILSRDGSMERSTYLIALVLCFVIAFFLISVFYINTTKDETSFMIKIVGLTLLTVLLIMQALSFYIMEDKEREFDAFSMESVERAIEGGEKFRGIKYNLQYSWDTGIVKKDYSDFYKLDLTLVEVDFENTILYEEIKLLPVTTFRSELKTLLSKTKPHFDGYKLSILDYIDKHKDTEGWQLKSKIFDQLDSLNKTAFIHSNKISVIDQNDYCNEVTHYLNSMKGESGNFAKAIFNRFKNCKWDEKELKPSDLQTQIYKYVRFFKPSHTRNYRKSKESYETQKHFVTYMQYDPFTKTINEVGFSYKWYRESINTIAKNQTFILILVVVVILGIYPIFFKQSLVNPLKNLLQGVTKVNNGNLDVNVSVKFHDEIGFLSSSFNSMTLSIKQGREELQKHAETLEEKVEERTLQLKEKMDEVQKLKVQQDGDYYLTSLLAKPLFFNANKSENVKTEFVIRQKKNFEFRNKKSELGGDICITGNVKFGTKDKFKIFTMAMNGDAMGKSMQGAGGAIVMGVVMNSIMARTAGNKKILDTTPQKWLTDIYNEIHGVFKSFNGTMVISCVVMLIDDETGEVFYFNAEHPYSVIYRDHHSSFIENSLRLRKLGLDSEIEFKVYKFQLIPGDVIIVGSDGRDDIDLSPNGPMKTINEDETLFLEIVNQAKGDLKEIEKVLLEKGTLIDDLSLLRISYIETQAFIADEKLLEDISNSDVNKQSSQINKVYSEAIKLLQDGKVENAAYILGVTYNKNKNHPKLNKLYGLLCIRLKDYSMASSIFKHNLQLQPDNSESLYYFSISEKKLRHYTSAQEAADQLFSLEPNNVPNLINLSDLHRLLGRNLDSIKYAELTLKYEPNNQEAKKLIIYLRGEIRA
ncbi:MAG: SpoIIE family protein phosphatase [Leptospiraceae bacterium]|nr:SpoIIE family protein phosphatase [Leptospiraceae bacterium]MCP5496235.1 SpoIIE family protein phosphatase [Leptospiraceae bacterium]